MLIDEPGIYINSKNQKIEIVMIKDSIAIGLYAGQVSSYTLNGKPLTDDYTIIKKYTEPRTVSRDAWIFEQINSKNLYISFCHIVPVGYRFVRKETVTFTVE